MTISSEVRKAGPFDGNDVADTFPFTFKVFTESDVLVVRADSEGVETTLVLTTDYTVDLNANQETSPGGDVVLVTPLPTGETMIIASQLGNLQPMDLTNQGGFFPSVINAAMDRATIQIQQLDEKVDRAVKMPITSTADADSLVAGLVVVSDNIDNINAVAGISADVTTVAGISADVTTVAGIASDVTAVAAIDGEVAAVAAVGAEVAALGPISANIVSLDAVSDSIPTVAAQAANVGTVGDNIADVTAVAAAIPDIQAAVADLPSLAAKVSKTGDTGSAVIPSGTTAQRDGSPSIGYTRWNTTLNCNETWNGTHWEQDGWQSARITASGATLLWQDLPPWARRLRVDFRNLSTSGTAEIAILMYAAGGAITSGYSGTRHVISGAGVSDVASLTTSFRTASLAAAGTLQGAVDLTLIDLTNHIWSGTGRIARYDTPVTHEFTGSVSLVGVPASGIYMETPGFSFDNGFVYFSWSK